ncbi:MAG: cytochrome P450 [Planctomycetota bacterium]|nr:cytochrome P450 [Planctomycetota bacterium]
MVSVSDTVQPEVKEFKGPKGHWWWGSLKDLQQDALKLFDDSHRDYGDYVVFRTMGGLFKWYLISDPAVIEHIFVKNPGNTCKPQVFYDAVRPFMGLGLFSSEGKSWKRQRKMIAPAFQRERLDGFAPIILAATHETLQKWDQLEDGAILDIQEELVQLTLNVVTRCFFGSDFGKASAEFAGAIRIAFDYMGYKLNNAMAAPLWIPTQRNKEFKAAKKFIVEKISDLIAARRKDPTPQDDLLARFFAANDEQGAMTDQELIDQSITMIIAGHDTMAASLSWTFDLLSHNPKALSKLEEELKAELNGRDPEVSDLKNFTWTKNCYAESLRLYPPAWGQPRQMLKTETICGYEFPKGAILTLSQWIIHRDPRYWDKPLEYDPARFLPENSKDRPKYTYFPFGGGPRLCIGQQLALMEAPLILSTIAQRYRLEATSDQAAEMDPTFTLRPKDGLKMRLRRRGEG